MYTKYIFLFDSFFSDILEAYQKTINHGPHLHDSVTMQTQNATIATLKSVVDRGNVTVSLRTPAGVATWGKLTCPSFEAASV